MSSSRLSSLTPSTYSHSQEQAASVKGPAPISEELLSKVSLTFLGSIHGSLQECFDAAYEACQKDDWDLVKSVSEELNAIVNTQGRTVLLEAICTNMHELAAKLMEKKITVQISDNLGNNAFHYSVQTGNADLIQKIRKQISVNKPNVNGQTPLHVAAEHGHDQILPILLASGAERGMAATYDLNGVCFHNVTAKWIAVIKDHPTCVKLLEQEHDFLDSFHSFPFDEDAVPSGQYIIHSARMEIKENEILIDQIDPREMKRIHFQMGKQFAEDPALLLALANSNEMHFSPAQANHFKMKALEQLKTSAEEEVDNLSSKEEKRSREGSREEEDKECEELPQLISKKESLEKQLTQSKKEVSQNARSWKEKLKAFHQEIWSALFLEPKQFLILFHELREINPQSMEPFYPFLSILSSFLPNLKYWMEAAKNCDPSLTYAFSVNYLRMCATPGYLKGFPFDTYDATKVLDTLKILYPEDLALPILIQAFHSADSSALVILPKIAEGLRAALRHLASGQSNDAVKILAEHKRFLVGYSLLDFYLTLAWTLEGDFTKASTILKRGSQLLDYGHDNNNGFYDQICDMFRLVRPNDKDKNPIEVMLEAFLAVAKKPSDVDSIKKFVDSFVTGMSCSDVTSLVITFFGIQWLSESLVVRPGLFDSTYRPVYESLGTLLGAMAALCHKLGDLDPWIPEHCQFKDSNLLVKFPTSIFFEGNVRETFPEFEVLEHLHLSDKSVKSLATNITKRTYDLIVGLGVSHIIPDWCAEEEFQSLPLADYPTMFIEILHVGFTAKTEKHGRKTLLFDSAHRNLTNYLEMKPEQRPYRISPQILEWAKFSTFAHLHPSKSVTVLEQEVLRTYCPTSFNQAGFHRGVEEVKEVLKLFIPKTKGLESLATLAFRDVQLTIANYSGVYSVSQKLSSVESPYTLFKLSQTLFGWRPKESFDDWGRRLKKSEREGPAASNFHRMEEISSGSRSEFEFAPQKRREALDLLLKFWLKFHEMTKTKNAIIKGGKDEDEKEFKGKDLSKEVEPDLWKEIIKKNKLELFPNQKKLSQDDKSLLLQTIASKREYMDEVSHVKSLCEEAKKNIRHHEMTHIMAAALLVSCEFSRDTTCHSIFMDDDSEALQVYQILLNVSVDRLVRAVLIAEGADHWSITGIKACVEKLEILLGKFHGPEEHLSGYGPLQVHYNAGVITSSLTPINTHLYFKY